MQLVRCVTPNECIVTLKTNNCNKVTVLNCCQNRPAGCGTGQKLTDAAEIGAGQSGLNWPCFDQMLEVSTSSTFLSMLGVLVDQFARLLGHWEGLTELQWQGMVAKCKKCTKMRTMLSMRIAHRIVHPPLSMHVSCHH